MTRTALITGISGQDGSYLAEHLLTEGYRVVGTTRPSRSEPIQPAPLAQGVDIVVADLQDQESLTDVLRQVGPTEVYNLAAQSFVPASWSAPVLTGDVTALGVARLLEAIRRVDPSIRFYQASSSEMFGDVRESPQNEETPFHPRTPYGVAKVYAHFLLGNYRKSHGFYAVSGISYNHESPRRGPEFVTRKVSDGAARISLGLAPELRLGDLESARDWGYAGDFVRAMWLTLQQDQPRDYVIATGEIHTVRELCQIAFARVGLDYRDHVVTDPQLLRPPEGGQLVGDASRARRDLGWVPRVSFPEMVRMMVDADLERLSRARRGAGADVVGRSAGV